MLQAKLVIDRLTRAVGDVADVFQAYDYGFDRDAFVSTATNDMKLSRVIWFR